MSETWYYMNERCTIVTDKVQVLGISNMPNITLSSKYEINNALYEYEWPKEPRPWIPMLKMVLKELM